ncbi:MAG TPA: haloacid dehalogenase-like hydrolase, partial [Leptospiraceae bacterium]|nr:haloacid dehalogenase-like hydrolase [Leptospiraceae bacterium]
YLMDRITENLLFPVSEETPKKFQDPQNASKILSKADREEVCQLIQKEYSFMLKSFGLESAYRWTSFLFSGWTDSKMQEYAQKHWESSLQSGIVRVFDEMQTLLDLLRQNGWEIWIVTASPEPAIRAVAHHFLIPEDSVFGMKLEKNSEGFGTERISEPYTYGDGKVRRFLSETGHLPDLSFGDSINDFPLLQNSRSGVFFDRGNEETLNRIRTLKHIQIQKSFS